MAASARRPGTRGPGRRPPPTPRRSGPRPRRPAWSTPRRASRKVCRPALRAASAQRIARRMCRSFALSTGRFASSTISTQASCDGRRFRISARTRESPRSRKGAMPGRSGWPGSTSRARHWASARGSAPGASLASTIRRDRSGRTVSSASGHSVCWKIPAGIRRGSSPQCKLQVTAALAGFAAASGRPDDRRASGCRCDPPGWAPQRAHAACGQVWLGGADKVSDRRPPRPPASAASSSAALPGRTRPGALPPSSGL